MSSDTSHLFISYKWRNFNDNSVSKVVHLQTKGTDLKKTMMCNDGVGKFRKSHRKGIFKLT